MSKRAAIVIAVCLLLGACGGDSEGSGSGYGADPSPSSSFPFATAILDNGDESTLVTVEVAETAEQQERGLAGRTSLPEDQGMVFVFFEEREAGFWMKDTTIPLSIAFFDAEGTVVRIMDMDPCEKDPCEMYEPGVAYMGALEVNQGLFEQWDISEGDKIRLTR